MDKKIKIGLSAMYEYNKETDENIEKKDFRINSYLSFTFPIIENVVLASTTYFQPLANYLKDYRLSSQSNLILKVTYKLKAIIKFSILYDSFPAINAPKVSENLYGGIRFDF